MYSVMDKQLKHLKDNLTLINFRAPLIFNIKGAFQLISDFHFIRAYNQTLHLLIRKNLECCLNLLYY